MDIYSRPLEKRFQELRLKHGIGSDSDLDLILDLHWASKATALCEEEFARLHEKEGENLSPESRPRIAALVCYLHRTAPSQLIRPDESRANGDAGRVIDNSEPEDEGGASDGEDTSGFSFWQNFRHGLRRHERRYWFALSIVSLVCGYLGSQALLPPEPLLLAPHVIRSHEAPVSGVFPKRDQNLSLVLYVKPEDGHHKYWRDLTEIDRHRFGYWSASELRFGNKDATTMDKPLPLEFKIFAVFVRPERANLLPGSREQPDVPFVSDAEFLAAVSRVADTVVASESVRRDPPRCTDSLELSGTPVRNDSRIRIHWAPPSNAFVEVRRDGRVVREGNSKDGTWEDELTAGIYEFTLRAKQGSACYQLKEFVLVP
ncbi:MAG: hypothetical protein JNM66_19110 [Bryobacterales bacterium]|nr:hypothetical protein [Bryobacterales bacterium]